MKFFATSQVRELDKLTIEYEPISSIDLMERAAQTLYIELLRFVTADQIVLVFAGPGNNGGDALALARMLLQSTLKVQVIFLHGAKISADCETNRLRLIQKFPTALMEQTDRFEAPRVEKNSIIIDGLFGSGLSRPLTGIYAEAVNWINQTNNQIVSIDIPSGLNGENLPLTPKGKQISLEKINIAIVKSTITLSLQFPKLSFLFPENEMFVGRWKVFDIGILPKAIEDTHSNFYYLEKEEISGLIKKRSIFSHKGTFGNLLIFAGSKGMAGASVLASKAALRSGAGLVSVHGPECNRIIVQTANPEVIFQSDKNNDYITQFEDIEKYEAIAVGPGIGLTAETTAFLRSFLSKISKPCVLDADALNLISQEKDLLDLIPENSILTPHPKEFERIFGKTNSSYERMMKAQEASQRYKVIIILKGAHTLIALPDGRLIFNSTGNSGMATAGSGDVLTGIIVSLLAQGYLPENAAKIGVYIHGFAGDLASESESQQSMIAGDIITNLGKAFKRLSK